MKSFLEWFKSSAKVKRWIFLIIVGISLACYGFTQVLVAQEMNFNELGKIIAIFVVRIYLCDHWNYFYSKKKFGNYYRSQ